MDRARADFFRAAVLRWMIPRLTARSRMRMASSTASLARGAFSVTAARAVFTDERIVVRAARLRRRRFKFCLIRFLAELVLATLNFLPCRNVHELRDGGLGAWLVERQ